MAPLSRFDRRWLMGLALCFVPARHGDFEFSEEFRVDVVKARKLFSANLLSELKPSIALFAADTYNPFLSIRENVVFGKIIEDMSLIPKG